MKDEFFITISLNIGADSEADAEEIADEIVNKLISQHENVTDGFVADVEPQ